MLSEMTIETEAQLIDQMTTPSPEVAEAVGSLDGDVAILGISGKMGPTLGELLVRAGASRVIGVSRFSDSEAQSDLDARVIETIKADLLDDEALGLPTEDSVTIALRTQQIIAEETGIASHVDPMGGSEAV